MADYLLKISTHMQQNIFLIGIAGGSGSGKTTFAKKVMKGINSSNSKILHMDSYYLPTVPKINGKPNYDHPDAFDWVLLRQHLIELKKGHAIQVPKYDFATSSRTGEFETVGPCKVVLFEGIFSLYDQEIRNILDIKCFLHVDSDIRFTRRLHRDVKERGRSLESVIAQYYDSVRPMYQKYLDPQKQYADFTVGEETDVAALILAARIKQLLHPEADAPAHQHI
ncbi:MAG: uridine kinase [Bacteriovoracaceae bacterium]|nr:uridine kinase [Bacteriovoracaceae bacterium]